VHEYRNGGPVECPLYLSPRGIARPQVSSFSWGCCPVTSTAFEVVHPPTFEVVLRAPLDAVSRAGCTLSGTEGCRFLFVPFRRGLAESEDTWMGSTCPPTCSALSESLASGLSLWSSSSSLLSSSLSPSEVLQRLRPSSPLSSPSSPSPSSSFSSSSSSLLPSCYGTSLLLQGAEEQASGTAMPKDWKT
jgi:hypothetical protein